jgi:hypothetical protein
MGLTVVFYGRHGLLSSWRRPESEIDIPLREGDLIHTLLAYETELIGEITNHEVLGWGFKPIAFTSQQEWHEDVVYAVSVYLKSRPVILIKESDLPSFKQLESKSRRYMELASIDPASLTKKKVVGHIRQIFWED